jgi:NAD(P)-dependent dehydrogenase (short-subunit alcohol dehydrogenase family)
MRVKDLRVLITGAASGAGRTIAEMLADADARVFVSDISGVSVADLSNARPDILVVQADAGNEAEIDDMLNELKSFIANRVDEIRARIAAQRQQGKAIGYLSIPISTVQGSTPDRVESRLGPLEFKDGVPAGATADKLFDHLDFNYASKPRRSSAWGLSPWQPGARRF